MHHHLTWELLNYNLDRRFALLEQLVKLLLSFNFWCRSTECYISQVFLSKCEYLWNMWRHQTLALIIRAGTATLPILYKQLLGNSYFLSILFCFIILLVTIWGKDNNMIIYLSTQTRTGQHRCVRVSQTLFTL